MSSSLLLFPQYVLQPSSGFCQTFTELRTTSFIESANNGIRTYHPSLSSITPGQSSRLHPVSLQSWCMQVFADQPTLVHICIGFHERTSLMNSSLLLQQCPICLVHLTRMIREMGSKCPCNCYFVWCCFQNLF